MDMSYQEKSTLGSLLIMAAVYGWYFAKAYRHLGQSQFDSGTLGRLMGTVIVIIVIEIVYHILLALDYSGAPQKDERDLLIDGKAYRVAYFTMFSGMSLVIAWLILAGLVGESLPGKISVAPFLMVNIVLLVLVLTELLKFAAQLFYYRWGVR
jgi:hypothetical protein